MHKFNWMPERYINFFDSLYHDVIEMELKDQVQFDG